VLLRELREQGYIGGYTMLKALVAWLKPKEVAAPIVRFRDRGGRTDAGGLGGHSARQQARRKSHRERLLGTGSPGSLGVVLR
jgi:hypothetical protein